MTPSQERRKFGRCGRGRPGSGRLGCRGLAGDPGVRARGGRVGAEADPGRLRNDQAGGDDDELGGGEGDQPPEGGAHESVGMEADAEEVGAEPRPAGDDVAADGEEVETAFLDHAAPAHVEDEGIPEDDDEGAIFLRVPTPEAAPGLVGPDAAEDGPDEGGEGGEAEDAVDHAGEAAGHVLGEGAGSDAEDDVEEGQEPGEVRGGISERDDDDVGREPEVGVEDRLHHLEGVAAEGQVVGDDECGKGEDAAGGEADGVLPDGFEQETESDRTPSDEDGGRVEVGDGWAAFEPHARDEGSGVDDEGDPDEGGGAAAGPVAEREPERGGEEECNDVEDHRLHEGSEVVVDLFAGSLGDLGSEGGPEVLELAGNQLVEVGDATFLVGVGHAGELADGRVELPGAGLGDEVPVIGVGEVFLAHELAEEAWADAGFEECVADLHPLIAGEFRMVGRDDEWGAHGAERQVALAVLQDVDHRVGVEGAAGKAVAKGGDAGGDGSLVGGEFGGEVGGARGLERGLKHGVEAHGIAELEDRAVIGGVLRGIFRGFLGLLLDFLPGREELVPRVVLAVLAVLLVGVHGELELALEIRVIDAEGLPGIGNVGLHHDLDGPFGGRKRPLLGGVAHRLLVPDLEEGVPGEGIEGLEPTVEHERQAAEFVVGEPRVPGRAEGAEEPDDGGGGDEPVQAFHGGEGQAAAGAGTEGAAGRDLRTLKATRWMRNWTVMPTPTTTQPK